MAETHKPAILVVDDEAEILFSLRALLRREFEVCTAESGEQALEVLRQHKVHVVMTDQRMPNMTGVELLSRAREVCPEAVRIIFTGYADLKAVIEAINRGEVYRYLTKPWDPDDLCLLLREACEHYDVLAEPRRLLAELRDHLAQGLEGRDGELWTQTSKALVARVNQALADKS